MRGRRIRPSSVAQIHTRLWREAPHVLATHPGWRIDRFAYTGIESAD